MRPSVDSRYREAIGLLSLSFAIPLMHGRLNISSIFFPSK
nr:MAG TPA: hypothetical protein [Caudoviricetes sp.]